MTDHTAPHWDQAALITVDVQRDFTLPGAPAEVPGTAAVVPAICRIASAFRRQRRPIVHVVRLYIPDGSNADLCRREGIESGRRIVTPGGLGAELVDELKPDPTTSLDTSVLLSGQLQKIGLREWVIFKPRWGAFYATDLEKHLRGLDVNTLVIAGCNFPNCPRTTLYEASERDFRLILATDAVSGVYEQGLRELSNIGVHLMTAEQLLAWGAGRKA